MVDNPQTPNYDIITVNAGKAHSRGIEGEIAARPIETVTLGLNFSVLEAEYDEANLATTGEPLTLGRIPYTPDYTASIHAEYRNSFTFKDYWFSWFLGGELMARGESYLTDSNHIDGQVSPHEFINLRAGFETQDGRWRLTIWGRNVTDKMVKRRLYDLSDSDMIGQKLIVLNDPQTFGASLHFSF
jgi:iron complex outermembrane receptor protein